MDLIQSVKITYVESKNYVVLPLSIFPMPFLYCTLSGISPIVVSLPVHLWSFMTSFMTSPLFLS